DGHAEHRLPEADAVDAVRPDLVVLDPGMAHAVHGDRPGTRVLSGESGDVVADHPDVLRHPIDVADDRDPGLPVLAVALVHDIVRHEDVAQDLLTGIGQVAVPVLQGDADLAVAHDVAPDDDVL